MKTIKTFLAIVVLSIILLPACSEKENFSEFEKNNTIQLNSVITNNDGDGDYINPDERDKTE